VWGSVNEIEKARGRDLEARPLAEKIVDLGIWASGHLGIWASLPLRLRYPLTHLATMRTIFLPLALPYRTA
jgi:hypothetical protein